jgi:hypothetical protein
MTGRPTRTPTEPQQRIQPWALLATLGVLVGITMPDLGSGAWPFDPPSVDPRGVLGPLVRVADREWDLGILRSTAILAGLLVALAAAASWRFRWPRWAAVGLAAVVCAMLLVPAVLLQAGLRDATAPWYFTNDSTFQIEIAGDLVLDGDNPYGHDYGDSGLENFYPAADDEEAAFDRAARHHFAYFPGTALTAAAWRILPRPWDDYRLFVLLATMALLPAALLFPGPLVVRLAVGSGLAANPLIVQGAWFGTADAPALLALVFSFALLTRGHPVWAGASLGAALALKQFALVAVPFLVVMFLVARVPRRTLYQAGAAFAGVFLATVLPFLIADPGALWDDTVAYGANTYRIVGYGLAALLLNLGAIDDRFSDYPFLPLALLVWLPITAWLLWSQWRARTAWAAAAGFSISMFVLLFLSRVFQPSYLLWPLTGIGLALLLASAPGTSPGPSPSGAAGSEAPE